MVLPLVLALALQAAPEAAGPADPLAQARSGMLQCYAPDTVRRTCKSLASYVFGPNGIENQAEVLVSPAGPLVMKNSTPVQVREGRSAARSAPRTSTTPRSCSPVERSPGPTPIG